MSWEAFAWSGAGIMPVPTLLHTHKCLMRDGKGNVSSCLGNSFQLALQLAPWKRNKDFGLSQPFSLRPVPSSCN